MRYERRKEFTALLSITSAVMTLGVATVAVYAKVSIFHESVTVLAGIATLLAATAAAMSILWSRRLSKERENQRVFLIYAKEDLEAARRLAGQLRERGFRPWLDVEEITPGQLWQKAVLQALEESAAALVLVSEHLEKKGFVQEELRAALSALQEREENVSPVIPVRLSEAPVPSGLAHVQWVNLFEPDGIDRLETGLRKVTA